CCLDPVCVCAPLWHGDGGCSSRRERPADRGGGAIGGRFFRLALHALAVAASARETLSPAGPRLKCSPVVHKVGPCPFRLNHPCPMRSRPSAGRSWSACVAILMRGAMTRVRSPTAS